MANNGWILTSILTSRSRFNSVTCAAKEKILFHINDMRQNTWQMQLQKNCEIIAFEENKSPFDMIGFFPSPYLFYIYGFGI